MESRRFLAPALLAVLTGCAAASSVPPPGAQPPSAVSRSTEQGGRFLALVGPRLQHAEPFLGVPGTNIYALRSWIDTRTGEAAHQLYVSESYVGAERNWEKARDAQGQALRFVAISKNEITCERTCSYAEEFAASFPETRLRQSLGGMGIIFTARSGAEKTMAVSGDLIQKQLTAVDESRAALPRVTAVVAPPPSPTPQ